MSTKSKLLLKFEIRRNNSKNIIVKNKTKTTKNETNLSKVLKSLNLKKELLGILSCVKGNKK